MVRPALMVSTASAALPVTAKIQPRFSTAPALNGTARFSSTSAVNSSTSAPAAA